MTVSLDTLFVVLPVLIAVEEMMGVVKRLVGGAVCMLAFPVETVFVLSARDTVKTIE